MQYLYNIFTFIGLVFIIYSILNGNIFISIIVFALVLLKVYFKQVKNYLENSNQNNRQ